MINYVYYYNEMDNMDDFDADIWHHEKHKMTNYGFMFSYSIEKNTIIKNVKLIVKYKDCDEKFIFNNLNLEIEISGVSLRMPIRVCDNNFIASFLGIKNSIYLIPIIQKNQNSYIYSKKCFIHIRLMDNSCFTPIKYIKYINKVYVKYEKLKDNSSKKTKLNLLIMPLIEDIYSNIGRNYIYDTNLNLVILATSLGSKEEEQKRLEFNEMILNVAYYDTKIIKKKGQLKRIGYKKIKINYDDLIIKQFLGNIFYIIPFYEKTVSIKDIVYNYHKNKDKKNIFNIKEVHFVPNIKINENFVFHIF